MHGQPHIRFIFVLPTFLYCSTLNSLFASGIIRAVKEKEVATLLKFSSLKVYLIQRINSSGILRYIREEGWTFLNLKMKALQSFETSVTIYSSPGVSILKTASFKYIDTSIINDTIYNISLA